MPRHTSLLALLLLALAGAATAVWAQTAPPSPPPTRTASPLHPTFPLLDVDGRNVLETDSPVSPMQTCGSCHDAAFIAEHNSHANGDLPNPLGLATAEGQWQAWDWNEAGTAELNCFLCHLPEADNASRVAETGQGWSATATLAQTGWVTTTTTAEGWAWNPAAFSADGHLLPELVTVQDPTNGNCGQCHGVVHSDPSTPLTLDGYVAGDSTSVTTGQIFSPQPLSQSGLNLADKNSLTRSWDVHAERVVQCTNCHYSLNNPVYYTEAGDKPAHLEFDPRRLDFGEYLYRPLHDFASGSSDMRSCQSCHSTAADHEWLPYLERHTAALSCQSCHIPKLYAPALAYVDWTVLLDSTTPAQGYRGMEAGAELNSTTLLTGYEPVLLPRLSADGSSAPLTPYNLLTSWYWVQGEAPEPVALADLQAAWFTAAGAYHPSLLAVFDANGDGQLTADELAITNNVQETAVANRLAALGVANPRIAGEVQPSLISHNVTHGEWVSKECQSCHADDSRLSQPIALADRLPGGVVPTLLSDGDVQWAGTLETNQPNDLRFVPQPATADLYVLGHNAVLWVDRVGIFAILGVMVGIFLHGGARVVSARRHPHAHVPAGERVYMYDVYERLWHWLQTAAILLLLFTGLVIHKPDIFGLFSFAYMVQVHNVLAAVLVVNAALAFFYHVVSGEIRQFLPRPRGFFGQMMEQSKYYLSGIFKGEEHPFAKSKERKLNPLQQITYLAILNVLLPLQIITGTLMWGAQRWPELVRGFGGLPFLGPFHSLIAWLFAAFILLHVYLTTTGHTPLANIKAMMGGWEGEAGEQGGRGAGEKDG
jgi:thiosulfate reductase cytochrome b subunit